LRSFKKKKAHDVVAVDTATAPISYSAVLFQSLLVLSTFCLKMPPTYLSPPEMVVKNRYLGFLIWQFIISTAIFIFFKILTSTSGILTTLFTLITFQLSQLLFSVSLSIVSSPQPNRHKQSLSLVLFVAATAVSGFVAILSLCWPNGTLLGFRGFANGLFYALFFVFKQRWLLHFPIIQRPPFFSFKMGLPSAIARALKLSFAAFVFSALVAVIILNQSNSQETLGKFIIWQIIFYVGSFVVFLCWELSHHLYQVLNTKRFIFAPLKGSAAAETNPSEPLLAALEESTPRSLMQYLAYLDLCMVCENNVDTWRRAAFFEETGETYKRVIYVCLKPLEQLASKFSEGLEGCLVDKAFQVSNQPSTVSEMGPKFPELLNNYQLYAWCARSVASLTAKSHSEDRFGVAQLSGSNAAVISTLASCLFVVEAYMMKKTNLQPSHHLMGPAGIKWATMSTGRKDVAVSNKRGGPSHVRAYAMADVLRTSIYRIVSTFNNEMVTSAKAGHLEKDWVISGKPVFGTREMLLQKLRLFLDFQAT
ncbi:Ndc1_Nup domain-containing protein, partial [Cephalotus follicularis]